MELDELKLEWNTIHARLDELTQRNKELSIIVRRPKVASAQRRLLIQPVIDIAGGFAALLILGNVWAAHWREPNMFPSLLVLHLAAVMVVGSNVVQVCQISRLSASASVVETLAQFAVVKRTRMHLLQSILISAPVLWTPLMTVGVRVLFGVDLVHSAPVYVMANFGFSMLFVAVAVWLSMRYSGAAARNRKLAVILDSLAGRSVQQAHAELLELSALLTDEAVDGQ